MIKVVSLLLLFCAVCMLSSCIRGSRTDIHGYNVERNMNVFIEIIVKAINEDDKGAIQLLFSKNILDEVDNLDENIEIMFAFIQGTIESWEKLTGSGISDLRSEGHRKRTNNAYYYVNTAEHQYFFLLHNCSIDSLSPDNVGLQLLLVVRAEDENEIYNGDNKILFDGTIRIPRVGVYLPIE